MFDKEKFTAKYHKIPVEEYTNNVSNKPLVSVIVQTFQQVNYIAKCLDSILMQKTNFDFEILVGEDDSSDGTREICLQYAKRYPDKIRLFLHLRENIIPYDGRVGGLSNFKNNIYNARGKYLAICEGDDYWIDSLKLQKQVDFLNENTDYGMIFSDIKMINGSDNEIKTTPFYEKLKILYKSGDIFWPLIDGNFINTLTACVKTELLLDYMLNYDEEFAYDYRFWLHVASKSKIKYANEKWANYRVHDLGVSRSNNFFNKRTPLVRQSALLKNLSLMNHDFDAIDNKVLSKVIYTILKNKYLTWKEKTPTISLIIKKPKYIVYLINNFVKGFFSIL